MTRILASPERWYNRYALPGTKAGNQQRYQFEASLLSLVGGIDTRLFWIAQGTDTTTSTDLSLDARTLTWDATTTSRFATVGTGETVSFNGTSQYATTPDTANVSFGDSANDMPMSVLCLANVTSSAAIKEIVSKYDITTAATKREWRFLVDASDKLQLALYDEANGGAISRLYNTAVTTGSPHFYAGTYDGSRSQAGITLYVDGGRADNSNQASGTYTAMNDTAALVYIGASQGASAVVNYFSGSLGFVIVTGRQVNQNEIWAAKAIINDYYALAL